jgi:hypothetical protein
MWDMHHEMMDYKMVSVGLEFADQIFGLAGEMHRWDGFIYFNSSSHPVQTSGNTDLFRLSGNMDVRVGNFGLRSKGFLQQAPDIEFRIPSWAVDGTLFYEQLLFDEVLLARFGVDFLMFGEYLLPAYLPFAGRYHHQNTETGGNYPFAGIFISGSVQQVRIFFRYDHFYANYAGNHYFIARGYPQHPAAFRFGVNWKFFN